MKTKIIAFAILTLLTTCSKEPGVTAKVTVTNSTLTTLTSFTANWEVFTGATGYFLDVASDAAFGSFVSGFNNLSVTSTSALVTGLTSGTTYYYRVRATTAGGTTENSSTITVLIPLPLVRFFGDSITKGLGASTPDKRWTSVLCKQKNWLEDNNGTSWESLLKASENTGTTHFFDKYQSLIVNKPATAKYIFISYGAADCFFNFPDYTTDMFSTQLQTIITFANSKGWANESIVVLCGYHENEGSWRLNYGGANFPEIATLARYRSFIAAAQTVASNNVGVYFVNPFDTYDETGMNDWLQPNDIGHAAIAALAAKLVP
jgi:lysophospholipase L1-like esterase